MLCPVPFHLYPAKERSQWEKRLVVARETVEGVCDEESTRLKRIMCGTMGIVHVQCLNSDIYDVKYN